MLLSSMHVFADTPQPKQKLPTTQDLQAFLSHKEMEHFTPAEPWTTAQWDTFIETGALPAGSITTRPIDFIPQNKAFEYRDENEDLKAKLAHQRGDNGNIIFGCAIAAFVLAIGIGTLWKAAPQKQTTLLIVKEPAAEKPLSATPANPRNRQALTLVIVALWTSGCLLYQTQSTEMMRHPEVALITAMFYASPAILLGAVGFWWFWPLDRTGKVERLF